MEENKSSLFVPISIIICILLIGGAVYYKGKVSPTDNKASLASAIIPASLSQIIPTAEGVNLSAWRKVDSTDKVRGSTSAPIKVVVYTDLECPACKYFHQQLKAVEKNYVDTGKLAIVIRDFPLDSLHQKSRAEHLAASCVADIGGNDKYWQFVDKIFEITPSNDGLDPAKLTETVKALGLDSKKYEDCVANKKYADAIEKTVQEAVALGAQGTPFFVIETADYTIPVFGGVPADRLSQAFDILLNPVAETPVATSTTPETSSSTVSQ